MHTKINNDINLSFNPLQCVRQLKVVFNNNVLLLRITLLVIISICISSQVRAQACYPSGIVFNSQAQLNDFLELNPNCSKILGDLVIDPTEGNIYSFAPLINITEIGGSLRISNHTINNFDGLHNLIKIGGDLRVIANDINTFRGLES